MKTSAVVCLLLVMVCLNSLAANARRFPPAKPTRVPTTTTSPPTRPPLPTAAPGTATNPTTGNCDFLSLLLVVSIALVFYRSFIHWGHSEDSNLEKHRSPLSSSNAWMLSIFYYADYVILTFLWPIHTVWERDPIQYIRTHCSRFPVPVQCE